MSIERLCAACGAPMSDGVHRRRKYCSRDCVCKRRPAPAVYRFVCPDGRSYVGSAVDHRRRARYGLQRHNPWIDDALATHPAETWTFEVLKTLPPGCSEQKLRRAEQRQIERLRSWMPEHGFNIAPAVWQGSTPGLLAARSRRVEQSREFIAAWRRREAVPPHQRKAAAASTKA